MYTILEEICDKQLEKFCNPNKPLWKKMTLIFLKDFNGHYSD
jgi:hypothetical protein